MANAFLRLSDANDYIDPATGRVRSIPFAEETAPDVSSNPLANALQDKVAAMRVAGGYQPMRSEVYDGRQYQVPEGDFVKAGPASPVDYLRTAARVPGVMLNSLVDAALSGATLPHDAATGKTQVMDPETGHVSDEALLRSLDLTGLMASGTLGGVPEGSLGSGAVKPYKARLYHGLTKDGQVGGVENFKGHMYLGDEGLAKTYSEGRRVVPADVSLENPLILDTPEKVQKAWKDYHAAEREPTPDEKRANPELGGVKSFAKWVEKQGYDGLVVPESAFEGELGYEWAAGTFGEPQTIAFNPAKSVKTDTLFAGGKGSTVPALLAAADRAPPFFSPLERAVQSAPVKSAPAEQWLGTLQNMPGVKGEEFDWRGMGKYLEDNRGKTLTKDDVLKHLEQNKVEVQEVRKGANGRTEDPGKFDQIWEEVAAENPGASAQEIDDIVAEHYNELSGDTKFSEYQLPGGDNYREMLFTLPKTATENSILERAKANVARATSNNLGGPIPWENLQDVNKSLWLNEARSELKREGGFQSSHWDEPNVLAHVRVNDREMPVSFTAEETAALAERERVNKLIENNRKEQGEAARLIRKERDPDHKRIDEEVLADVKAGRIRVWDMLQEKVNRQVALPETEGQRRLADLRTQEDMLRRQMPEEPAKKSQKTLFLEELQSDWHQKGRAIRNDEIKRLMKDYGLTKKEAQSKVSEDFGYKSNQKIGANQPPAQEQIPDAPFKKTWPDLILKRMVREAAENGYDQIAWTDGATQAERYDLSRHVDRVTYTKQPSGNYNLFIFDKNGRDPISKVMSEKELPDFIGEEVADKIIKDEGKVTPGSMGMKQLSGLDFKIDGKGMKGFYDNILPKTADKLFKKYGAKTEKQELPTEYPEDPKASVHVLHITPELRRAALSEGFPLFSSGAPVPTVSDDGKWKLVPVEGNPFATKEQPNG